LYYTAQKSSLLASAVEIGNLALFAGRLLANFRTQAVLEPLSGLD
jgi:hypothetical protein